MALVHTARIGNLGRVVLATTTPLQRLRHNHHEAEAAWLWSLLAVCAPRVRKHLSAAHTACKRLEAAKSYFDDLPTH